MTTLYKLTDEEGQTLNNTQWGEGVSHSGTGKGNLCGRGYIHAYEHPLIAVLMNVTHADFIHPRLWEAEGEIALREGQLKCGCVTLTTIRELPLPWVTLEQRVRIARECVRWADSTTGASRSIWAARWAVMAGQTREPEELRKLTAANAVISARNAAIGTGKELPLLAIIQQVLSED